ncbi:hypothetical protein AAMO2058_001584500 [Amorphochlora amoebiformis]
MEFWERKSRRPVTWTPELESIFAIYCRKYAFDFEKVSEAMIRYIRHNGNSCFIRLVDPFCFSPDVCRVHWSYRDYLKRKADFAMGQTKEIETTSVTSPAVTYEGADVLDRMNDLVSQASAILAKDSTQPTETPSFDEIKKLCDVSKGSVRKEEGTAVFPVSSRGRASELRRQARIERAKRMAEAKAKAKAT